MRGYNMAVSGRDAYVIFSSVGSFHSPHADVILNNMFVSKIRETSDRAQLAVDVLLVLEDCSTQMDKQRDESDRELTT